MQAVAPSVVGRWGREVEAAVWSLLESDRVDLIGSDAHGVQRRRCHLQRAAELVATRIGVDAAARAHGAAARRRPRSSGGERSRMSLSRLTAIVVNWRTPDYTVRAVRALVADGFRSSGSSCSTTAPATAASSDFAPSCRAHSSWRCPRTPASRGRTTRARGACRATITCSSTATRSCTVPAASRRSSTACRTSRSGSWRARLLNVDGTLQSSVAPLPSPAVAAVQASGLSRFVPDRWQPSWSAHWSHTEEREVEAAIAAALLVRGAAWDELGGFDESAFMYAEDRDLCWRARLAGVARVVHPAGGVRAHRERHGDDDVDDRRPRGARQRRGGCDDPSASRSGERGARTIGVRTRWGTARGALAPSSRRVTRLPSAERAAEDVQGGGLVDLASSVGS